MQSMSSQASSWTLMEDFFVQECCVHGTDLENHGLTSILCDDPLPIESTVQFLSRRCTDIDIRVIKVFVKTKYSKKIRDKASVYIRYVIWDTL